MPTEVFVEVTDTLARPYTAGHQRIVRSLVSGIGTARGSGDHAGGAAQELVVVPVVRHRGLGDYRRLTPAEEVRLGTHPPGGRARRRAERFGPLSPVVRTAADLPISRRAIRALSRRSGAGLDPEARALTIGLPPIGSVWLDLEPAWRNPEPRRELLARLRASGVHSAALVVDVIPELNPEWYPPEHVRAHRDWLRAHLLYSGLLLCLSRTTESELSEVAERLAPGREPNTQVVPNGSDPLTAEPVPVGLPAEVGRYLLVVATLAPRKNQRLSLDAFERLHARHQDLALVLVGREGPDVADLVEEIESHPLYGRRLLWLQGIDDAELAWLYRNAFLAVAPSRREGVGVPVVEALRHGCPVVCSEGGALAEAGAGRVEEVDPDDADALAVLVERHLLDPVHHRDAVTRAAGFNAPTWQDTAAAVAEALVRIATLPPPLAPGSEQA